MIHILRIYKERPLHKHIPHFLQGVYRAMLPYFIVLIMYNFVEVTIIAAGKQIFYKKFKIFSRYSIIRILHLLTIHTVCIIPRPTRF